MPVFINTFCPVGLKLFNNRHSLVSLVGIECAVSLREKIFYCLFPIACELCNTDTHLYEVWLATGCIELCGVLFDSVLNLCYIIWITCKCKAYKFVSADSPDDVVRTKAHRQDVGDSEQNHHPCDQTCHLRL